MEAYIEIFFDLTGNLATSITLAITIITSASLLLVNVARYFQAKKYGIPLDMVNQASLPDSLDLWVILISAFGFGHIIPGYVSNMDINIFMAFAIVFISCFGALMFLKSKANFRFNYGKSSYMIVQIGLTSTAWGYAIISLIITCLFMYVGYANRILIIDYDFTGNTFLYVLFRAASIILRIYGAIITAMFAFSIIAKIYGDKDVLSVEIEGQPYILATRHSPYQWVLVPCSFGTTTDANGDTLNTIKFTKGRFIIRDMAAIESHCAVVCRKGYSLYGADDDADGEESALDGDERKCKLCDNRQEPDMTDK